MASSSRDTSAAVGIGYQLPPQEMRDIADAPPLPKLAISPKRDKIVFLKPKYLPPLSEFANPEVRLAGVRINTKSNSRSRMPFYSAIGIQPFNGSDCTLGPEEEIVNLPQGAKINFVSWSKDGQHLAFTVRVEEEDGSSSKLSLWIANVETREARQLVLSTDKENYVNDVYKSYAWVNNKAILVCTIPSSREEPPERPSVVPSGPMIVQDVHKDEHDKSLFEYYATSQLVLVYLDGSEPKLVGLPAIYIKIDPSPDDNYILISTLNIPGGSLNLPLVGFPRKTEVWEADGTCVKELCCLDEDLHTSSNSVRTGKRFIDWRADKPSTLYWVETQDGGDPNKEVSPRDIIYTQSAETLKNEEPTVLHKLDLRYGRISWCDDSLALVYELWRETRTLRIWAISPGSKEGTSSRVLDDISSKDSNHSTRAEMIKSGADLNIEWHPENFLGKTDISGYSVTQWKKGYFTPSEDDTSTDSSSVYSNDELSEEETSTDSSSADVYSNPELPILRKTRDGTYVIAKVKKSGDESTYVLLKGSEATPKGKASFLDLFEINTGKKKERIWISDPEKYYESVAAVMFDQQDGDLSIDRMRLFTSKESNTENTQYFVLSWPNKKSDKITDYPHPYPKLASLKKEKVTYKRKDKDEDEVELSATLYLPPGYDSSKEGPLSCLVWFGELHSEKEANKFARIGPTSPLLWLARRFAVFYVPAIPFIGSGDNMEKNRYVKELVGGAEAAVEEVKRRGVAHPQRIVVGGHSIGAFMAANLIALAPHLFCCGIASSRGFQKEHQTLWKVMDDDDDGYIEMSPFMSSKKTKKPILVVRGGEEDNNHGTLKTPSVRLYNASEGRGVVTRLVTLPCEGHNYVARESIMHALWEIDTLLQMYCDYKGRIYTDLMSGDVLLVGPGRWRNSEESVEGMVLEVETQLIGYQTLYKRINATLDGVPYDEEGNENEDNKIIDLVQVNSLVSLPRPSDDQLKVYLKNYRKNLIPLLDEEKAKKFDENFEDLKEFLVLGLSKTDVFAGIRAYNRNLCGSLVFAHYRKGRDEAPTLLYLAYGLKAEVL